MTVRKLHSLLGKLVEKGQGRVAVCVDKRSFRHNLEADGAVILDVVGVRESWTSWIDDDGGTKVGSRGQELGRQNVILFGGAADKDGNCDPPDEQPPCPMSRGEFYATIRMLEVFAPADPLITRLQTALGQLGDLLHTGNNCIGHEMAVEVDRLEKMKTATQETTCPSRLR